MSLKHKFRNFFTSEVSSGILMIVAMFASICLANTQWHEPIAHFWETQLFVGIADVKFSHSLEWWKRFHLHLYCYQWYWRCIVRKRGIGWARTSRRTRCPWRTRATRWARPTGRTGWNRTSRATRGSRSSRTSRWNRTPGTAGGARNYRNLRR